MLRLARPFKFRYVNEIVGTFVLLILGITIAGILSAGRIQGWFGERRTYHIVLPYDTPTGLRKGSEVYIFSTVVGSVRAVHVSAEGEITAEVRVRGDLLRFVREDSVAIIRKKFGVAGDAFVEITKGHGRRRAGAEEIHATLDEDVTALMLSTIREVSEAAKLTMFQVNRLLAEYTSLARSLEDPVAEFELLLRSMNSIASDLELGKGSAGKFLKDTLVYDEAGRLFRDARTMMGSVEEIMADAREVSQELPAIAREFPYILRQVETILSELQTLLEGVQKHWLIRRYIDGEPGTHDLKISPGDWTEE